MSYADGRRIVMVYSNDRKLELSGWLKDNSNEEYNSPLKLQKFLLFYEVFAKVDGDNTDFDHLKGYKRGPVFSNVWGDYTHERTAFDEASENAYKSHDENINIDRAKKSMFLVRTMSEKELSELTHKLNIWKSKEDRIMSDERQVDLDEQDFNDNDANIVALLEKMYPVSLIDEATIIRSDNNYYVFSKEDAVKLTEQHFDTLSLLSDKSELCNPVFVELDENGRLIVD